MASVTIYHSDGTTESLDGTVGWSDKQTIGEMRKLQITVTRAQAQSVSLTRRQDEIELDSRFRGVLTDIKSDGASYTLVVRSPEWYATQQAPTVGGDRRQGTDTDLLSTLIGAVPEWSAGTVDTLTGPMTFVFNHAFANEAMRKIEKNVPGELQWSGDGTVDYVEDLGTDRSASLTLSASNGTLEGGITVTEQSRQLDATHLRVIGAHEGEAQFTANLVPNDDPNSYANEVRYSQPRWSDSSDTVWDRWSNKDVMSQSALDEEAAALADELTETVVEAEATVAGDTVNVGDWVHVEKPEQDLDRDMRVHRVTTKTGSDTTAAVVQDVLLSTRTVARSEANSNLRDIQRYNTAWQGSSVAVNVGPYRQAIDATHPVTMPFRYPDLQYENDAVVQVRGLEYRVDSQGAAGGGDHTHSVSVTHPSHSHDVSVTHPSHSHDVTLRAPPHQHDLNEPGQDASLGKTTNTDTANGTDHDHIYQVKSSLFSFEEEAETSDTALGTTQSETSDTALGTTVSETSDASGEHTHPINPGIFETNDTPSNVDVLVNDSTIATDIGSGTFQTTVDVAGEFNPDDWNTLQLQSDTLGAVQATVFLEGYAQIGTTD